MFKVYLNNKRKKNLTKPVSDFMLFLPNDKIFKFSEKQHTNGK